MQQKIPVTVLTGFLGSGKTTLLNRILSEEHGLKIAVIENEFGEIGIDQELVINTDEEILEMNNGCICCTVRGDLLRILSDLAKRQDKFDRVILETTGMADPGPVAQTFFVDETIRDQYMLDGIITLVDTKHAQNHLNNNTQEVMAQVAFADRIILNKADLVEEEQLLGLKERLQDINKMAEFYQATMAEAPINDLLNIGGFNLDRALEMKPSFLEPEYPFEWGGIWQLPKGSYRFQLKNGPDPDMAFLLSDTEHHEIQHTSGVSEALVKTLAEKIFIEFSKPRTPLYHKQAIDEAGQCYQLQLDGQEFYEFTYEADTTKTISVFSQHTPEEFDMVLLDHSGSEHPPVAEHFFNAEHEHNDAVSSVAIEIPGVFDMTKINSWLGIFLQALGQNIYRMKGVMAIEGAECRMIFQGVHMMFTYQAGEPWGDEEPTSKMIFIGLDLEKEFIRRSFEMCLAYTDA